MIYLENKIGVPQDIMIVKEVSTKKTNKAVTEQQAKEIAQEEAKAAVDAQQFKTINGEDIRGTGNIEIKGGGGTAGVNSINGQSGDLKLKTINNNDILGEGNIEIQGGGGVAGVSSVNGKTGDVRIVQPFWDEAAVKCGVDFRFKIDESGNETIESVIPRGYQDVELNKHRFFQNFFSTDETQKANIGLYAAVFTQTGGSAEYPSRLTYGTINTWGDTNIKNTEENPDAEVDYYTYYASFTVISPYTFTKYDVTVLSYYITAEVEDTNTWKIIWKKAN
nr:MAG TPA: hypothetical protein [Caudoviricetes sp.]